MDAQGGQVPAPRRPVPRLRRPDAASPASFAVPGELTPRVADLSALLGDIDALRLTLQTDLTLAAAALEAGAPGLAGELVDGDLAEVRGFGARAADRLSALTSAGTDEVEVAIVTTPVRRRRIMSAAPLMAAAAALIGFVAFVPDRGAASSPETRMTSAVAAGYELNRLAEAGAPDEALRLAAEELNDKLADLIAQAATDPAAAQQALMLLDATSNVLASQGDSGVLRSVLAETQLLRERLRDALPVVAQRPTRKPPVLRKVTPTLAAIPVVESQPEKSRDSAAPSSSAKPTESPKPSPKPTPASPTPPSDDPSPEPSSSDRDSSDGPLPQPDDLPGW